MKEHFSLSDHIQNSLNDFDRNFGNSDIAKLSHPLHTETSNHQLPNIPENPTHETNRRLNIILDRIEAFSPIIAKSVELFRNTSDTVLQMHTDFNKSARQSTIFSLVVIVIAALSLSVTAVYSWWGYTASKAQQESNQELLIAQQTQIETIIHNQNDHIQRIIDAMQERNYDQAKKERQQRIETVVEALNKIRKEEALQNTKPNSKEVGEKPPLTAPN